MNKTDINDLPPRHIWVTYASSDFPAGKQERGEISVLVAIDDDMARRVKMDQCSRQDIEILIRRSVAAAQEHRKELIATHVVDYDSFDSDSAYLDRIDRVLEGMEIADVTISGPLRRYAVDGIYSEGDQQWSDWEQATCRAEAEWRGAMTMAANEFGSDLPFVDLMDYATGMTTTAVPEPVTKSEYRDLLQAVVRQAEEAGHDYPALAEARSVLDLDEPEAAEEDRQPGPNAAGNPSIRLPSMSPRREFAGRLQRQSAACHPSGQPGRGLDDA